MNGEFSAHELSDPNPAVYILFPYHSNSWQGCTRRHPTTAVPLGEAHGPYLFLPCSCPHPLQVCILEQVPKWNLHKLVQLLEEQYECWTPDSLVYLSYQLSQRPRVWILPQATSTCSHGSTKDLHGFQEYEEKEAHWTWLTTKSYKGEYIYKKRKYIYNKRTKITSCFIGI